MTKTKKKHPLLTAFGARFELGGVKYSVHDASGVDARTCLHTAERGVKCGDVRYIYGTLFHASPAGWTDWHWGPETIFWYEVKQK